MIGERIGNFNVVSQLGRGGMGEVYLGEHEKIGTRVAVKVLQPHISSNKDQVERFFNEAIAVSKIQHSGIGKIFDVGFHASNRAYLVMEFLAGETLATRIRRLGKLPLGHVCELGRQICGVLEAVHKAGITHRDLKPDNIFIVPDDELPGGERIKIVDFGIAKLSGVGPGLTATNSGSMGTPAYMSPEQWKNSKAVDWRADAYSLGCLTFEMIAGRPPFIAETIGEACALHLTEEPPRLGSLVAIPEPLDSLVANLLAKLPEQRPPSMRDIANAFAGIAQGVGLGASDTLSAPAMALGATMPSTPPVAPNMATQATVIPMPAPSPMPSPMPNTTLRGASAEIQQAVPPKSDKRWLIWALAGAVAALVVVVVVLAVRDPRPAATTQEHGATVEVLDRPDPKPDDKPKPPGSGSGSSIVEATTKVATRAGSAVSVALTPPRSGSGTRGRTTRRLPGREGPQVEGGSKMPAEDNPSLPNRPDTSDVFSKQVTPRIRACAGQQGVPRGTRSNMRVTIAPDGSVTNVSPETPDANLAACVKRALESARFPRSRVGTTAVWPFTYTP